MTGWLRGHNCFVEDSSYREQVWFLAPRMLKTTYNSSFRKTWYCSFYRHHTHNLKFKKKKTTQNLRNEANLMKEDHLENCSFWHSDKWCFLLEHEMGVLPFTVVIVDMCEGRAQQSVAHPERKTVWQMSVLPKLNPFVNLIHQSHA